MRAVARLAAEVDGRGGTRITGLRSQAPLILRLTPDAVYLVGGAGGPLGGDDVRLDVEVGPGAEVTVRSAAASVALPGHRCEPSRVRVRVTVGAGAVLRWLPEPLLAACGCDHRVEATIDVCAGGRVEWREELLLGRHGEGPGSVTTRLTVDVDGRPLLRHELGLGSNHRHAAGPAVVGPARAVGTVVMVDPVWSNDPAPARLVGSHAVVVPLEGPGVQVVALAADAIALRHALDAGVAEAGAATPCP